MGWSTAEYQPLGVVGVIGPWNYPVFTPMGSIVGRTDADLRRTVGLIRLLHGRRGRSWESDLG